MLLELQNYFQKFKIKLDLNEQVQLKSALMLERPHAKKEKKKIYLKIGIQEFLSVDFLTSFFPKIAKTNFCEKTVNYKIRIHFRVDQPLNDQTLLWAYIDFVKNHFGQPTKKEIWSLITPEKAVFEPQIQLLTFQCDNRSEEIEINPTLTFLEKKLRQLGLSHLQITSQRQQQTDQILDQVEQNFQQELQSQQYQNFKNQTPPKPILTSIKQSSASITKKKWWNAPPSYPSLKDLEENAQNIIIHGKVLNITIRSSKTGRKVYSLVLTDYSSSIKATYFAKDQNPCAFDPLTEVEKKALLEKNAVSQTIQVDDWIALKGRTGWSNFDEETVFTIDDFKKIDQPELTRQDQAAKKRVELHLHSKMSAMDGVTAIEDYLKRADLWDWEALAITDHANVQAFPEAFATLKKINQKRKTLQKKPLKLIYGAELILIQDQITYVHNPQKKPLNQTKYVFFDLETTGLSPEYDEIIEFGALVYDYQSGKREEFDWLIKPEKPLKSFTKNLTKIDDEMLADQQNIVTVFPKILELIDDAILVAHNATFDLTFLQAFAKKLGYPPIKNPVLDTLTIARALYPGMKNHRLGTIAKKMGIAYDESTAHRGNYDATVLSYIFERIWYEAKQKFPLVYDQDWQKISPQNPAQNMNYVRNRGHHVNLLVKNQNGLKKLYKLISLSHTQNLLGGPKIFQSELQEFRKEKELLIGAPCINSEIFDLARTSTVEVLIKRMAFYDYVEIQPLSVYKNLLQTDVLDPEELQRTLKLIIQTAEKLQIPVVATSDAHYLDPHLKIIREVYIHTKGLGGSYHPLYDYKQRVQDYPEQHLRTTQEMLAEFAWLNDDALVEKIVLTNPQTIAAQIETNVIPVKSGTFDPKIANVDQLLREKCYATAHKLYGSPLPEIVAERLELELNAIIKHGFAVIYWISHKLVEKSLQDGYLVGSRGSVGSSFVARMSEITEVNPLKAHYRCEKCCFADFKTPSQFRCGYDLPTKNCPQCQNPLLGDGHDIPFETFLGFNGDKVPDIDLNFSGDYQPVAHQFIKQMFGEKNVFRAGTISTVADKTAYGFVKNYFETQKKNDLPPRKVEIERLANLATGVKRTTGQHPGGIIILPQTHEIEDFTPVNYPADDQTNWMTTHFDFHSIHDNLLKMDILGHVDPTALKMLRDLTGIDPLTIPMNDPQVYQLFSSLEPIQLTPDLINGEETGAIGIPEFGTAFVRGMLRETHPQTFADLVQISGLSHGTDVWLGNAQTLIKKRLADISSVIGCRDDIMVYLLKMGLAPNEAFMIMEAVRKGQGLKPQWKTLMTSHQIPSWYLESCEKIKYMFPKAHATAYVLMAYRIAWFKIYWPAEYYATFFSTRANAFELQTIYAGYETTKKRLEELIEKASQKKTNAKENDLITTLEVALEMLARGIKLENIDFNQSWADRFIVLKNPKNGQKTLLPPFNIIDSLGTTVAVSIVEARKNKSFQSLTDLKNRTQITQTQVKIFEALNVTDSLSNDEQLSFNF